MEHGDDFENYMMGWKIINENFLENLAQGLDLNTLDNPTILLVFCCCCCCCLSFVFVTATSAAALSSKTYNKSINLPFYCIY